VAQPKTLTKEYDTVGKNMPPQGETPAIALINPKYPHNVGQVVRAAASFGIKQVWFTGNRVSLVSEKGRPRLPREERMKAYEIELRNYDYFLDQFPRGIVPVAFEVRPNAVNLYDFEHPKNAVYLFGPEDGSIPQTWLKHCHHFVFIPTLHCVNLSAAVYLCLQHRDYNSYLNGEKEALPLSQIIRENRTWAEPTETMNAYGIRP
jgi:tRNA(Leu) C34 or U34 (ribose-2'-O)-methylase TrmL